MELSIIIVNFKTPELTKACVASIKKYPPKIPYEIIVIDNSEDNIGFARGNNKGIRQAKGKYILLLNSDTKVKEGSIEKLYQFAKITPDAGAVVPKLLNADGSIQASVFTLPTIANAIRQYWFGQKILLEKDQLNIDYSKRSVVEAAVMAAFLITPISLKKVGVLDEKYYFYFEDLDYCKRIKEKGLKIYYIPEAEVIHYKGASGGTNKLLVEASKIYHGFLRYYIISAIIWIAQKWQKLMGMLES